MSIAGIGFRGQFEIPSHYPYHAVIDDGIGKTVQLYDAS